jgi:serine/threonine protein kinase
MSIKPLYEFDEERRARIVKIHLEMPRGGTARGPIEGAYGEVYSITFTEYSPRMIAAKCPRIKRFGSPEKARTGIEQVLHELEKTHQVFTVPWINRIFDVQFIQGWPFILSCYRDGTLEDLIANPLAWSVQDKFVALIQVVRALQLACQHGILAHQDLKPANVFFDDLSRQGVPKTSKGMHFHMFVADFGLANAFQDFGRNSGSRPYMAPEQFSSTPMDPSAPAKFDIFALGVLAFECFTDGKHPLGITTSDVWPWKSGVAQKWNRESTWRNWAIKVDKSLPIATSAVPPGIGELVLEALAVDPSSRPSLQDFEDRLWDALKLFDADTHAGVSMQVKHIEGLSSPDNKWPHMDERLRQLRKFYSDF